MSSESEKLSVPYFDPSELTDNFARLCHLILIICSDLLRDIIGRHISPSELTSTIDNKRDVLWDKFNKQQQKEIYPGHARVLKVKDFDISLCYIILRNICNIPEHTAGWGKDPEPGDYSVSACIDIIRIERNKVCAHSVRGTIDQPEFLDHWNKIKEAIIHLEQNETGGDLYERGVDCLWSCSLSSYKKEEYIAEMKNVKSKLESIDGSVKGLQATVGIKMACKRARLDQLEESQNATLTDISEKIDDLEKNVVDKVHGLHNYLTDQTTKSVNELTTISKGLKRKFERTANDIEWNITEKIIGKMKELENALLSKKRESDSCDQSLINCSTSEMSNIEEENASLNNSRRSKSFGLHLRENERVIWICGWEKSCWVISLCMSGKVDMEHNQFKIYKMEESRDGLKSKQELIIHEPFLQGINVDHAGRLVYLSQSKMCVRYVTKHNIIKTLADLDETCVSYALCFDCFGLSVVARQNDTFLIAEKPTDEYSFDEGMEINAHLEVPRRLFKKQNEYPSVYAILHEGITLCKFNESEEKFKVVASVTINDSCGHELLDIAMVDHSDLKGLLLAYSNGIDLVDWEGNFHKRIYNETVDKIRTISVSEENLWIGHESNLIERIDFKELDLCSQPLLP